MRTQHYNYLRQKSQLAQLDSEDKLAQVLPKSRKKAQSVLEKAAALLKEVQYATV